MDGKYLEYIDLPELLAGAGSELDDDKHNVGVY